MPIPLIPVVVALSAGGATLVPHAAGGVIVSGASGYVAGTYLSTAALSAALSQLPIVTAGLAGIFVTIGGVTTTLIGGAGLFGTTIGATGITGVLMSWGIVPSVPIFIPVFIGSLILCLSLLAGRKVYRLRKLQTRLQAVREGEELQFSKSEAYLLAKALKAASQGKTCDGSNSDPKKRPWWKLGKSRWWERS